MKSTDGTKDNRNKQQKHAAPRRLIPAQNGYRIILLLMAMIGVGFLASMILIDVLPSDLTFILIAIMLAMIVAASIMFASRKKGIRIAGIAVALVFAVIFSYTMGFMGKTYAMLNKISDTDTNATGPAAKIVDVTSEPFNIYATGIDQWAHEKGEDLERSDVNMIITVNPLTNKVLLTSIPRDTYVELHTAKQMDKLTHTGVYGVEETLNTVHDWLNIDFNYYVKVNFTGVMTIITTMNGIDVYSPVAFKSSISENEYVQGWNHLSGKQALYFARERKAFEGKDDIRVENQQRVVQAIIKKMTSSPGMIMDYGIIMDAAGDQIETNLSQNEMSALARKQITELTSWDVQTQKIKGEYDQDYVASLTQSQKFEIYRPSEESVKECLEKIEEVMNPTAEEISEATKGRTKSFFVNGVKKILHTKDKEQTG